MSFERTADGDEVRFERTARDTGGELLQMRLRYRPMAAAPPLHRHPAQEERFEVVAGRLWVRVGEREEVCESGASFVVPPGTPHAMRPEGGEGAEVVWQVLPALDSEAFFRALWGLDGGDVSLVGRLRVLREHGREFELVGPPRWLQRVLFTIAGALAAARARTTSSGR
jgi:quercetin dioxygenase-like cupin family protein